jgi:sodium transport system permease protein
MNIFLTIFKKELIDTLRDRRTIIAMIIIPLLIFPVIIGITSKVQKSVTKKAEEKTLRIAVISNDSATDYLIKTITKMDDFKFIENVPEDSVRSFVQNDSLDGAFVFSKTFDKRVASLRAGRIKFYFKSSEGDNIEKNRMKDLVNEFEESLLSTRFEKLNLDEAVGTAVNLVEVDITSKKERIGKAIGGFLPYIFVIFCFIGSLYPAIDLAAGEKERGTLETLLTAPVNRFVILLGKFGVVVLAGVGSALVSIIGLYFGIRQVGEIPPEIVEVILGILEPQSILLLISLLLPLTMFFAGIMLSLSMFAKTFKEAQSILTPINFLVIIPVAIGLIPGITLDPKTALIPVLNVSLATKEIVAGTIDFGLLMEVYVSLAVLAGLSLFLASRIFLRETVIFRG